MSHAVEARGRLTIAASVLVALLSVFLAWRFAASTKVFAVLFEELGAEVPVASGIALGVPPLGYWIAGVLFAIAVIGKDWILRRERTRLQVTLVALIVLVFIAQVIQQLMALPMLELVRAIG